MSAERKPWSIRDITRGQIGITAGTAITAGVADVALHNSAISLASLLVIAGTGYLSNDILALSAPGGKPEEIVAKTGRILDAIAPVSEGYADQRAISKIRRLMHDKNPELYETQDTVMPGEVPAKPKMSEEEVARLREVKEALEEERKELSPIFPVYPDNETLHLGKAIDREASATLSAAYIESLQSGKRVNVPVPGRRFDPHFNGLFGKGIIAAANQGFGKSILNGVVIEQAGKAGVPAIVLDHKGEYNTVKELDSVNALLVGAPGSGADFILIAKEVDGSGQVTDPGNADEFVAMVMQKRCQAVINLSSYGSKWVSRAKIVGAVGKALMDYAEAKRHAGGQLLPCLVLLDEAQLYIPQNKELLPPEAQENKAVLSELSNAYFALVSNGRSNGYTMCFATQSLTYIAKWAIKSSQIRILGRHSEKNDLDMCGDIISANVATRAEIESFAPGVFVVFGFTPQPMIVQFDKKQSRDLSETPGIERLRAPEQEKRFVQPVQPLPDISELLEEESVGLSMHELCEAVIQMADLHYKAREIIHLLEISEREYLHVVEYIKTHRSEFMGVVAPSQSKSASPSDSPFVGRPKLQVVTKLNEAASEAALKGSSRGVATSDGNSELSELELSIGQLYFGDEQLNPNAIVKKLWPEIKGGDAYQKKSIEVNAAIRKYAGAQKGA